MKSKMETIMNTRKKKAAVAIVGSAIALTLCTGAAFAASDANISESKSEKGNVMITSTEADLSAGDKRVLVKNTNGKMSHSIDGGNTWNDGAPEGAMISTNEDGLKTFTMGDLPKDGNGLTVKNENGKISYSTDGGNTWSENTPEGFDVSTNVDGSVSVKKK